MVNKNCIDAHHIITTESDDTINMWYQSVALTVPFIKQGEISGKKSIFTEEISIIATINNICKTNMVNKTLTMKFETSH